MHINDNMSHNIDEKTRVWQCNFVVIQIQTVLDHLWVLNKICQKVAHVDLSVVEGISILRKSKCLFVKCLCGQK